MNDFFFEEQSVQNVIKADNQNYLEIMPLGGTRKRARKSFITSERVSV